MANHMEAVLDRETSPEEIEALLRKCNDERFKEVFGITVSKNGWIQGDTYFLVFYENLDNFFLEMWLHPDNKKLEFRMGHSSNLYMLVTYLEWYFFEYPVVAIGGIIQDECADAYDKDDPDYEDTSFAPDFLKRYPTFNNYVHENMLTARSKPMIRRILAQVPKELEHIV